MEEDFSTCLAFTLREEGGFVDNPADPGGATNMGITLATYRTWSEDGAASASALRAMPEGTAAAIYRMHYWNPVRADALPRGVDLSVFDFGVNAGIWRSMRLLQQALGFEGDAVDGCAGPVTLAAAARADAQAVVEALATRQAEYYRGLAEFPTFGRGWLSRTEARRAAALALLGGPAPTVAV